MEPEGGERNDRNRDRAGRSGEAGPGEQARGRRRHTRRGERKERVLHTRISEQLAEDIRRMAEELRVPVSNLVRNVLEEAFDVVETVTDNVGDWVEGAFEQAEQARQEVRRRRRWSGGGHHARRAPDVESAERAEPAESQPAAAEREPTDFPSVMGWQPLILNQPGGCADCEAKFDRGARAYAGLTNQGFSSLFLCEDCMSARR